MTTMAARLSLSQQVAQLYDTAPIDYDPENLHPDTHNPDDPAHEVITPHLSATSHYVDVGPSSIRKLQQTLLHSKYDGVQVSRKELEQMDDGDDQFSNNDDDDDELSSNQHPSDHEEDPSSHPTQIQHHTNNEKEHVSNTPDDLTITLKKTREDDKKKGKAISRQLAIYDSLLDTRIRLQKCVSASNRLPHPDVLPSYLVAPEGRTAMENMLASAMKLSDELFEIHEKLIKSNQLTDIITLPSRKRRRTSSSEIDSSQNKIQSENSEYIQNQNQNQNNNLEQNVDWDTHLNDSTTFHTLLKQQTHPYLVTTLLKWSDKVLAVAPAALSAVSSGKNKFSRGSGHEVKSAVRLIDETLMDRERIVMRTRMWRGKGERVGGDDHIRKEDEIGGKDGNVNGDTQNSSLNKTEQNIEIYDDTDFYQQLLRDVIDSRSGGGGGNTNINLSTGYYDNSIIDANSADWRESQKMKKAKKKENVDTRASKGRKLRYETHEKLVNFMVSVEQSVGVRGVGGSSVWHEEQIDELFASLLGRGSNVGVGVGGGNEGMDVDVDVVDIGSTPMDNPEVVAAALSGGFRVFG